MKAEDDWNSIRAAKRSLTGAGMGLLRLTLLFGSAAVALALLAVPLIDRNSPSATFTASSGVDFMTTGSIRPGAGSETYTIRRSVLQRTPDAVCIIRQDGTRSGDC